MTAFFEDFGFTVTFTTHVPVFTATTLPDFTLQYFAEEPGTLTVTFAPLGTLRFAVRAMLVKVAGLLAVRSVTRPAVAGTAMGVNGTVAVGAFTDAEQAIFAIAATSHFVKAVYSRRFTVPLETFDNTFELAAPVIIDVTDAEEAVGNILFTTAA